MEIMINNVPLLALITNMLGGTATALKIFFLTAVIATPLGVLVALGRMSRFRPLCAVVQLYQLLCRGTPLMLQLMFVFYAPYYLFGLTYDRFTACIAAFVLNYAAYFGEIFRGGITGIPRGQHEAGKVLGFTKKQTFMRIILPQVVKQIMPAMGNEFMTLVKDTCLASVISVGELFRTASSASSSYNSTIPLAIAGVFYLLMNAVVEFAFKKAEKKLSYYK